jgi:hypothetical protein
MNTIFTDKGKYEVYRNGNVVLASGDYVDAALQMLTYDSRQYELRSLETDEGLKWQLWIKTLNGQWSHARSVADVYSESYAIAFAEICGQITYYLAHGWGFEVGCLD